MATDGGPNIERDGLVFGMDTGYGVANNSTSTRFYRGEPTTNLASTDSLRTMVQYADNTVASSDAPEKGPGWKKVTITNRGTNFRTAKFPYISHPTNTTRIYSLEIDFNGTSGYFIRGDGFSGLGPNQYTDGQYIATFTTTTGNGSMALFLNNGTTSVTGIYDVIYYRNHQVETNNYKTPFTTGTRLSTESIIDLKRTTDINVSNISFNSTGQPTFDGTNDYFVTDNSFLITGDQTWEVVAIANGGPNSPAGLLTNHQYTSPQSNFGINYVSGNRLGASIGYTNGTREYSSKNTNYVIQVGVPFHAALKYDSSNNTIEWFINGISDSTYSLSATPNFISQPICSGRWTPVYTGYYFNGEVYVGKVYGMALTPEEIKQNFNTYKNRFNI